ncbi:MAG TPA: hemolysin family protein [Candidatus Baltobacteraceae bacterium]|nr:hemolysin family protein [Candidatus Baltobacteraceae bacterium]
MDASTASHLGLEIAAISILILVNGFFAGSEVALLSARRSQFQQLAAQGDPAAARVLSLKADPDRFLAMVQVGLTFVSTLASAVGGAAAVRTLSPLIRDIPAAQAIAEPLAIALVVTAITYVTLIIGELVPKTLGLRYAVSIALWVSRPLDTLARVAAPLVRLLTASNRCVLRILGIKGGIERSFISEAEVMHMVQEGREQGVFNQTEQELIHSVFEFTESSVKEVMIPRPRIQALDINMPVPDLLAFVVESGKSRYPVYRGSLDSVQGIVYDKDLFRLLAERKPIVLSQILHPAFFAPETAQISHLLRAMQRRRMPMALIIDEYGGLEGLVTVEDLIEEIVGEIQDEADREAQAVKVLRDGSYLVDASISIHDLADQHNLVFPESADYETLAGFVLAQLQRLPRGGEIVTYQNWRLTIVEMDGRRIARVKLEPREPAAAPPAPPAA